jgi:hypothetical protein
MNVCGNNLFLTTVNLTFKTSLLCVTHHHAEVIICGKFHCNPTMLVIAIAQTLMSDVCPRTQTFINLITKISKPKTWLKTFKCSISVLHNQNQTETNKIFFAQIVLVNIKKRWQQLNTVITYESLLTCLYLFQCFS